MYGSVYLQTWSLTWPVTSEAFSPETIHGWFTHVTADNRGGSGHKHTAAVYRQATCAL